MGHLELRSASVGLMVLLGTCLTAAALASPSRTASGQQGEVETLVLTGDLTAEVARLATLVVDVARERDVPIANSELDVQFVDRIEQVGFVGGRTDGRTILIGANVAHTERTLLHEFAHAVVGIEHGHDEPWRSVYLSALRVALGERAAERELRRIEWVYDKSYLETGPPDPTPAGTG
jgi:hypothetical protein